MPLDRDALRAAARPPRALTGASKLAQGAHTGVLADFVPLEALLLPFIPIPENGGWKLLGLFVVSKRGRTTPWGLAWWTWPTGDVVGRERLDAPRAEDVWAPDPGLLASARRALDEVLSGSPDKAEFAALAEAYRRAFPPTALQLARTFAPWL